MKKLLPFLFLSLPLSTIAQSVVFNPNGSGANGTIQQYVVPNCINSLEIQAQGAQGGNTNGGLGASMSGTFNVSLGDTLFIVVGQQGTVNACGGAGASSGGGGGSFVWKNSGASRTLLLVAGGGGGGNTNWAGACSDGINAVITNDGTQGNGPTSALGGTAGNGGFGDAPSGTGSGGAGWLSNGQNSTFGTGCTGGLTFPLFTGGSGSNTFGAAGEGNGGFGGGGGAVCGNGGGGGYSGGGGGEGSSCRAGGGGGGSYNIGSNQINAAAVQTGNGLVTIIVTPSEVLSASFSPNDTVCSGTMVTATASNGTSYNWNNGITNAVAFEALSSTAYQLTAVDTNGCLDTLDLFLMVNTSPTVSLGADIIQANPPANLDAGAGFSTYLWNTTESTQTIIAMMNGSYDVTVTDTNGCTDSDTIQVFFTAGANDLNVFIANVNIYPNPSNGVFSLNISNITTEKLIIEIMDMKGSIVLSENFGAVENNLVTELHLAHLNPGNYILRLNANGKVGTTTLIKQ